VVWLYIAFGAEILIALYTPNSVISHVSCCFLGKRLAFVILLSLHYCARNYLHDVSTLTTHEIIVLLNNFHDLILLDLLQLIFRQ
jgi:hypothetical protein